MSPIQTFPFKPYPFFKPYFSFWTTGVLLFQELAPKKRSFARRPQCRAFLFHEILLRFLPTGGLLVSVHRELVCFFFLFFPATA